MRAEEKKESRRKPAWGFPESQERGISLVSLTRAVPSRSSSCQSSSKDESPTPLGSQRMGPQSEKEGRGKNKTAGTATMDNSFKEFRYKRSKEIGLQLKLQCQVKEVFLLLMNIIYRLHPNEKKKMILGLGR